MSIEKVAFGFFIVLALTLNVAFVAGDIDNPDHHSAWLLFSSIVVNLLATLMKLGDRSQIGALLLATALVADLQLLAAAGVWTFSGAGEAMLSGPALAGIVSLATGALVANVVSVTMLVADTLMLRR